MLYKKKYPLVVFLFPGLLMIAMFLYYPFFENIYNSLFDMTGWVKQANQEWKYIGLRNYKKMFTDPVVGTAVWNSFKMMFLAVIFQAGLGYALALLVNSVKRGQQFFRTVYFFPVVISATALGVMFSVFYRFEGGMLNQILSAFGQEPVIWLKEGLAFTMISIPTLWSYVGFYFVIMLTGLSDISEDIYEAAEIDGCSKLKQVFYITTPLMRGVFCTCVTLSVTGALKVFDLPWTLAQRGAPQGTTHFLGTYLYEIAFLNANADYASAIALLIVIFGVIVSQVINRLVKPDKNL